MEVFAFCIDGSFQMVFPFIGCIEHSLTESHKQERVRISMELLRFLEEFSTQKLANRSPPMKAGVIWRIFRTQCGLHPEFPGHQESERILELGKR
jgi:hypothetical protein